MTRRLLDGLGLLALLLLAGGGTAAWLLVKQQVHVTFQDGNPARADDPVALLRDEVRQLDGELRRLRDGLAKSLENLAEAQAKDAQERELAGERRRDAERLRSAEALAAAEARIVARIAELQRELAAAAAVPAAPSAVAAHEPAPAMAAASQPAGSQLAASRTATVPVTAKAPVPPAQTAPARKRGSFLAFDLPADAFRFAALQTFEVVPSLSRVGFDGKSTLHDFTGATTDVGGELRTDLAAPAAGVAGRIWARARSLDTGLPDRNDAMREHLEAARHELIEFTFEGFETQAVDAGALTVRGTVTGTLAVRGEKRRFVMPVSANVDESRRLCVSGSASLKPSEFGIEVPTKLGFVKFTDEVVVWVALKLRVKRAS
jgi:polyisoprenoid-binding protein YceI